MSRYRAVAFHSNLGYLYDINTVVVVNTKSTLRDVIDYYLRDEDQWGWSEVYGLVDRWECLTCKPGWIVPLAVVWDFKSKQGWIGHQIPFRYTRCILR